MLKPYNLKFVKNEISLRGIKTIEDRVNVAKHIKQYLVQCCIGEIENYLIYTSLCGRRATILDAKASIGARFVGNLLLYSSIHSEYIVDGLMTKIVWHNKNHNFP